MDDIELTSTQPPDDTGTDTLRRYKYQAALAFRYCLDCVLDDGVQCVIMEHFEDFIVQFDDRWDFIQVKTRNPNLGAWTLSSAASGLKSLYRTYEALKEIKSLGAFRLALMLEGAVKSGDLLEEFVAQSNDKSKEVIEKTSRILDINEDEARDFVAFVLVMPQSTNRQSIHHVNKGLLNIVAPDMNGREVAAIYNRTLDEILAAMSADRLRQGVYEFLERPESITPEVAAQIHAKRLDSLRLNSYMGSITSSSSPLLRSFTDDGEDSLSALVKKLVAARATENIVKRAKMLRANASHRQMELAASNIYWDFEQRLEDVCERIGTLNDTVVALHADKDRPGVEAWNDMLNRLMNSSIAQSVDPNKVFLQDAYLLMGLNCEIADQCFTDWGVHIA
ncbi:dsDNA nuclease domain-containing protein [Candidatus Leptofilum sp.]|uniref:dsDNA nuclease domain-containing protein n=1 Tax=Candidatus Leptofilum sp. TaxID=3241576 RepID=UPI003B5C59BE